MSSKKAGMTSEQSKADWHRRLWGRGLFPWNVFTRKNRRRLKTPTEHRAAGVQLSSGHKLMFRHKCSSEKLWRLNNVGIHLLSQKSSFFLRFPSPSYSTPPHSISNLPEETGRPEMVETHPFSLTAAAESAGNELWAKCALFTRLRAPKPPTPQVQRPLACSCSLKPCGKLQITSTQDGVTSVPEPVQTSDRSTAYSSSDRKQPEKNTF